MTREWTLGEIASIVGGRLVLGDPKARAVGVTTDSRVTGRNEVFIAIRGPRFDGHDFVSAAQDAGAAVAIVEDTAFSKVLPVLSSLPVIVVADSNRGLLDLAASRRAESKALWVAITGSAGKTTTKELTAAALSPMGPVLKSPASFNNRIGVPKTILALEDEHRSAVVEVGTSAPGEIAELAAVVGPDISVVTGIGPAHVERFGGDVLAVAREKSALLGEGVSVLPHACEGQDILRAAARGRIVTFGLEEGADFRAEKVETDSRGRGRFEVRGVRAELSLSGRMNVLNALAALAVADVAGVELAAAAERLAQVEPISLRGCIREGRGLTIIEDCYNANPVSFRAALENLAEVRGEKRSWVIAGDMKELGAAATMFHRQLGAQVARSGAEALLAVGRFANLVASGAEEAGMPAAGIRIAEGIEEATETARSMAREGDLILVKGSRAMELERLVEALVEGDE